MMQRLLAFAAMGLEIGIMIYGAFLLGRKLDETYQTKGLIFAVLAFTFLAVWLIQLVWMVRQFQKAEEKENPSP